MRTVLTFGAIVIVWHILLWAVWPLSHRRYAAAVLSAGALLLLMPHVADAAPSWRSGTMTHYGEGDGYMGGRTACGKTVRPGSLFAAALTSDLARCGAKVTIRYRGRRFHTRIQDRGAFGHGRVLDAAPGLRKRMGFTGLAEVRYTRGWQ
jgi:rare lipoprotein A (peptidoglycan hydrolase)